MVQHPENLWYLSVSDTNLCVRVVMHIVVHYTHLAVYVKLQLGATRGKIIHEPWFVDFTPPVQH